MGWYMVSVQSVNVFQGSSIEADSMADAIQKWISDPINARSIGHSGTVEFKSEDALADEMRRDMARLIAKAKG